MTLYSDLEKDMLACLHEGEIQVPQVIELLCNLIDLKFKNLNKTHVRFQDQLIKLNFDRLDKNQTEDTDWETLEDY